MLETGGAEAGYVLLYKCRQVVMLQRIIKIQLGCSLSPFFDVCSTNCKRYLRIFSMQGTCPLLEMYQWRLLIPVP